MAKLSQRESFGMSLRISSRVEAVDKTVKYTGDTSQESHNPTIHQKIINLKSINESGSEGSS